MEGKKNDNENNNDNWRRNAGTEVNVHSSFFYYFSNLLAEAW